MDISEFMNIADEFSPERLFRHVKTIGETWPERLSGTEALNGAAGYVVDELKSYGLDRVALDEFEALVSLPVMSELVVLHPQFERLPSQAFAQIGNTPEEGIETELVYVGAGGLPDYQGREVRGKIVLAELSMAPPRPEKVRIATLKGAAAVVLCNWGPSFSEIVPMGTAKYVWGNPTPDNIEMMNVVPAIGISRKDGEHLIDLARRGPVRVRLKARATREWKKLGQPWARLEGKGDPDKFVLVGGHLDAWVQGITDNATGNALMLELARVLAKHRQKLRRSVEFAFWVGHENGILEGSTWFVDHAWDRLNRNAVLYVNVDQPGMRGTSRYRIWSSPETRLWHGAIDRELVKNLKVENEPLVKISDQSFFGVGVPSVYPLTLYSAEEVSRWHGAIVGTYFHSRHDTLEHLDLDLLMAALRPISAYVFDLCRRAVIPFEHETAAREILSRLEEYQARAGAHLDLRPLIENAGRLKAGASKLKEYAQDLASPCSGPEGERGREWEGRVEIVNRCLIRLSRILTCVRAQVADRYEQDFYGLTGLDKPLPALGPVERFREMERTGQDYKLLFTKMTRQRNRVSDAISEAIWQIDNVFQLLND